MKTIIIHHLQEIWDKGLSNLGTSFEEVLNEVCDHLSENHYDKVIVTNFESFRLEDSQYPIAEYCCPQVEEYGYGWDFDTVDLTKKQIERIESGKIEESYSSKWALGGSHSKIVYLADWMFDLSGEIYICGAFDGECIEDLEIALDHCGKKFKRIEKLIN